jgi:hypothetical protein
LLVKPKIHVIALNKGSVLSFVVIVPTFYKATSTLADISCNEYTYLL